MIYPFTILGSLEVGDSISLLPFLPRAALSLCCLASASRIAFRGDGDSDSSANARRLFGDIVIVNMPGSLSSTCVVCYTVEKSSA